MKERNKDVESNDDKISLVAISFLALFLELLFIRWFPANIFSLWYFSNIVLISSFLGIGIGSILSSRIKDLFNWFPIGLLFAVFFVISLRWIEVIIPTEGGEWLWNFHYRGNSFQAFNFHLNIYSTLALVFIVNSGLFVFIGQKVGILMSRFKSETAYGLDLLGAILGVLTFGILVGVGGWFGTPVAWFFVVGLITLWFIRNNKRFLIIGAVSFTLILFSVYMISRDEIWSPYYSIKTKNSQNNSLMIYVNRFFFQEAMNFEKNSVAKWKYLLPYHFLKPDNVLILGAGSGNDVATANSVGVSKIDAVEIDPAIYNLGVRKHPLGPYQNPNVTIHIDDARSFLKKHNTKYDMIVLGTLDSHALLSAMSTVRLDNFVYTVDSLKDIKNHLTENGIAVLQFSAPTEEFGLRLLKIATSAFEDVPKVAYWGDNDLFNIAFIAGPGLTEKEIKSLDTNLFTRLSIPLVSKATNLPTDDWPYLYLKERKVPTPYLKAIGILLTIALVSLFVILRKRREVVTLTGLNFFALGSAFLLLETKSITSLSLLFGSTWSVNAFVFLSILIMLYLANLFVSDREIKNIKVVYIILGLSLLLNYFLPTSYFLGMGYWMKALLSTFVATLPVLFSAIIFSYHFKRVPKENISSMYGINLAGAVFGGFLEYCSMVLGLRMLYFVAGFFYVLSFIIYYIKDRK